MIASRFRALDTNHDGKISATEFKGPKAAFEKYSDKNGLIGRAAYATLIHDQDQDGYITSQDLVKVAALRKTKGTSTPVVGTPAKTPVTPATHKAVTPPPAKPAAKPGTGTAGKPIAAISVKPANVAPRSRPSNLAPGPRPTNRSPTRHALRTARVDAAFDQIDVNHDGVLTRAEIRNYLAKQPQANPSIASHHKG